jgi:NTP pyrophosphatase (non-canonical NTP hydrolase)
MQLESGHELLTTAGIPRTLEAIWKDYSAWVLGRVHFDRAILQPKDTAEQYPFNVLMADLGSRGFSEEASEVLGEHKKLFYHGSDYAAKRRKIVEELGDSIWYLVPTMEAHHITLEEVLSFNVDKLVAKDGLNGEKFGDRAKSGQ